MSDTLSRGTIIAKARYRITGVLGQGGFGVTYLADHTSNGSKVAIKEYFPRSYAVRASDDSVHPKPQKTKIFEMGRDVFLEETHILRGLPKQRGLVRVYGALKKNNTAYCIMEYIEGYTLKELVPKQLSRQKFIPEAMILDLIAALVPALHSVHRARLVHRDIKPDNIMIRRGDNEPILIDFGAARPLGRKVNLPSMYTRHYAALEQHPANKTNCGDAEDIGPWTDVFALSVVLYELVTQGLPPPADERWAALQATGQDSYIPARDNLRRNRVDAEYSETLLDMIDAGCALRPGARPRTAAEWGKMMGVSSRPSAPVEGPSGHTDFDSRFTAMGDLGASVGRIWRKHKLLLIIAGLALTIAVVANLSTMGIF